MEAQEPVARHDSTPIVLTLAPTRELAVQIAEEATKLLWHSKTGNHRFGLQAACLYGGGDKRDQKDKLRQGGQLVVATPGRLLDFLETGLISLQRVTFFVLDEADRMLDLGFLGDVTSISCHIRPDRHVLFFSATWGPDVQKLALDLCDPNGKGPVRISCGQSTEEQVGGTADVKHQAREGIEQRVVVVDDTGGDWKKQTEEKRMFLERHIRTALESSEEHKVLVFVGQKQIADELSLALWQDGFAADAMHSGKSQDSRLWVLDQFRKGALRLLVCTDVLGRGIDLPDVSHVIIYEMGGIEDYIHRIGRTGRGPHGKGQALVFFEYYDKHPELAAELIDVLRASDQPVPRELLQIAADVEAGRRQVASWSSTWSSWRGGGWDGKDKGSKWDNAAPVPKQPEQQGEKWSGAVKVQPGQAGAPEVKKITKPRVKVDEQKAPREAVNDVPDSWDD